MAIDHAETTMTGGAPVIASSDPDERTPAVKIWAGIGVAFLLLGAYIIIKWLTGPNFHHVAKGPSDPPTWMKVELWAWQILSFPAAFVMLYIFVIRPWRREKRVGIDGLFVVAGGTLFVQDTWSNAGNHWFTYNGYMVNFGSWANDVPWFNAYGKPGHMVLEPILFIPAAYTYIMCIGAGFGCWAMKKFKSRRPQAKSFTIVLAGFVAMCLFDIVLEGFIWMPLGIYEYPGGHWSMFANTYHKYPLNETFTIGAVFTAMAALKYFRDDRGLTVIERGVTKLGLSPRKTLALRMLAVIGFVNLAMFLFYNVPNTAIGFNSTTWPADLQKRSYFLDGICGVGTDRACPGGSNPGITDTSVWPNVNGGVTVPDPGKPLPSPVPLDKGAPGSKD